MQKINNATIRLATDIEVNAAKGSLFYRLVAAPYNYLSKTWWTINFFRDMTGYLLHPSTFPHRIRDLFIRNQGVLNHFPCFIFNRSDVTHPAIAKAVLMK